MKTGQVTLNSWKEIADYLDRGVRTVQRWERDLGLPVRRIGKGKRSPVYATSTELRFWMMAGAGKDLQPKLQPDLPPTEQANLPHLPSQRSTGKAIEESHRLLSTSHDLAQTIAESSVRQRKQAEILQARILEIRARMK